MSSCVANSKTNGIELHQINSRRLSIRTPISTELSSTTLPRCVIRKLQPLFYLNIPLIANQRLQKLVSKSHIILQADKVVREKFDSHRPYIDMLSGGPNNMESALPSGGSSNTVGLPIAQKLREQLEDVETIKAERAVIESEIKGTKPDMKTVFLNIYAKDGVISEEQVSLESLGRGFGPLQKQVH